MLACVASDPEMRVSDIARAAGITERAAQGILHDLVASGYVERKRVGRRNHYDVQREQAAQASALQDGLRSATCSTSCCRRSGD